MLFLYIIFIKYYIRLCELWCEIFFSNFPKPKSNYSFTITHDSGDNPAAIISTSGILTIYNNKPESAQYNLSSGTMSCNVTYNL